MLFRINPPVNIQMYIQPKRLQEAMQNSIVCNRSLIHAKIFLNSAYLQKPKSAKLIFTKIQNNPSGLFAEGAL